MLQKLEARDEARKVAAELRRKERGDDGDVASSVSTESFYAEHNAEMSRIRGEALQCARQQLSPAEVLVAYDCLVERVRALQGSLSRAALFLAPYDVQRCQRDLSQLEQHVRGCKARVAPRGVFSFAKAREQQKNMEWLKEEEEEGKKSVEKGDHDGGGVDDDDGRDEMGHVDSWKEDDWSWWREEGPEKKLDQVDNVWNPDGENGYGVKGDGFIATGMKGLSLHVEIQRPLQCVVIRRCHQCSFVFFVPIEGSISLDHCSHVQLWSLQCGQVRIKEGHHLRVAIDTRSDPLLESSSTIQMAPWKRPHDVNNRWNKVRDLDSPISGTSRSFVLKK